MAKRPKAKYRVGQVVRLSPQSNRLCEVTAVVPFVSGNHNKVDGYGYEVTGSGTYWEESALRPLTARERRCPKCEGRK